MIYINENSNFVLIPRYNSRRVESIKFINQTTKEEIDSSLSDDGGKYFYKFDFSNFIDRFEVGQYKYIINGEDGVLTTGIIQYGDYIPSKSEYQNTVETIQYNP